MARFGPVAGGPDGKFCEGGELDVIAGSAGIALGLLDAHRITGDERYRRAAVEAADGLIAAAEKSADGWSWKSSLRFDRVYSWWVTTALATLLVSLAFDTYNVVYSVVMLVP